MNPGIVLIGGGVRCGKSAFALELARALGKTRTFIATAQPLDEQMRERARAHRAERGSDFETIEEAYAIHEALSGSTAEVVVLDCMTLWLSNLLLRGDSPASILGAVDRLAAALRERKGATVVVTNEVGMGLVPETELGRTFRDLAGAAHQTLAVTADEVYLGALGLLLRVKPSPFLARPPP